MQFDTRIETPKDKPFYYAEFSEAQEAIISCVHLSGKCEKGCRFWIVCKVKDEKIFRPYK